MPSVPDFETLFSQFQLFISTCNGEHIRYATDTFAGLCHQLTNALVERKQPLRGIGVLKQVIDKMQMNTNQLASIHADLCQLCLLAKCFKPALPYLDMDMMDICKENGAYDAKHFLCYYYYGGMIYTRLKNFERALYFYEQVKKSEKTATKWEKCLQIISLTRDLHPEHTKILYNPAVKILLKMGNGFK